MAQIDNAVEMLQHAAKSLELASEEDDGSDREAYWNQVAQTQATCAVAVALIAIHEAITLATRKIR